MQGQGSNTWSDEEGMAWQMAAARRALPKRREEIALQREQARLLQQQQSRQKWLKEIPPAPVSTAPMQNPACCSLRVCAWTMVKAQTCTIEMCRVDSMRHIRN